MIAAPKTIPSWGAIRWASCAASFGEYTRPRSYHVYFLIDVTDDKGTVTHCAAENDPPATMTHYGWSKSYLKPGDKVTVAVWPSKVGSPRGFLAKLVKADGTVTDHSGQLPPE